MDFAALLKQYDLLDIVTVDDTHYALSATNTVVPGCVVVLASQLPNHLAVFLRGGYSHRYRSSYSAAVGLRPWVLLSYSLASLPATKKQQFVHALTGTGNRKGLLATWHGQKVGRCSFLVPKESQGEAIGFCNHWNVPYSTEVVLRVD